MNGLHRLDDQPLTILKSSIESQEPAKSDAVEETGCVPSGAWSEEARRNISGFFRLLDQWDRQMSRKREVA
jgi:hypothetical protein